MASGRPKKGVAVGQVEAGSVATKPFHSLILFAKIPALVN
jgi:hypothetical protein